MAKPATYSKRSRWLHWLTVPLLAMSFMSGFFEEGLTPLRAHILVGITIVTFMVIRLVTPKPEPPPMSPGRRRLFVWNHRAIYLIVILLGMSGMATVVGNGLLPALQGAVPLPESIPHAPHKFLAFALIAMILAHVGGVFSYQLSESDVLSRMLGRQPRDAAPKAAGDEG